MKLIDDRGRIFGILNIIDLCILLVVVGAGIFLLRGRASGGEIAAPSNSLYEIKYMVEAIPDFSAVIIEEGDPLEDEIKGGSLGTITAVTVGPGYDVNPDINGELQVGPKEGYVSLDIVSEVQGQPHENGVLINGNLYSVGQNVTMKAGKGKVYILLYAMEMKGGQ